MAHWREGQFMGAIKHRRCVDELRRIDAALTRLEVGDYGYCTVCGERIEVGRLDADPATPVCIACARSMRKASPAYPDD